MILSLPIQHDFSMRDLNTFGIDVKAHLYLQVISTNTLLAVKNIVVLAGLPRLILGGGSNILFINDFSGLVLHICLKGIEIVGEDAEATYVRAAAGENWHQFVQWTLARGLGGLENLSLIPGSVGAAPIQNIGAYGVEVKDYIHSLRLFNFETGDTVTLDKAACAFSYRDSVFKHHLRDKTVIVDVTFALPKQWQPNIAYSDVTQELAARALTTPTANDISEVIIAIRRRKLPDPAEIGNAGSFFKNPIVSITQRDALLVRYPKLVNYQYTDDQCKLAAGWLIDQCGWKGKTLGPAAVYEKQALVLVNRGGAAGQDIARLASAIQADVLAQFGVRLEPEPIFIE